MDEKPKPQDEKSLVEYTSRDGQQIKLSPAIVRKYLVSGKPELVNDNEITLYLGMCKSRGLNPFKKDCYLIKYTEDPAATVVSIDYFRSRARAQPDCTGWHAGIIVEEDGNLDHREGSLLLEGENLVGGWFRAKPKGWDEPYIWAVSLKPFIKKTRDGRPTQFWAEEKQAYMIAKVAESQGLRRVWPDEFQGLFVHEEIIDVTEDKPEPLKIPRAVEEKADGRTGTGIPSGAGADSSSGKGTEPNPVVGKDEGVDAARDKGADKSGSEIPRIDTGEKRTKPENPLGTATGAEAIASRTKEEGTGAAAATAEAPPPKPDTLASALEFIKRSTVEEFERAGKKWVNDTVKQLQKEQASPSVLNTMLAAWDDRNHAIFVEQEKRVK